MNKELTTTATLALGVRSYESPKVLVAEIHLEGVLCASAQLESWSEEKLDW